MNTRTLTFISVGMILTVGLFVGSMMMTRPVVKSAPVFMGEELVVTKTVAKPMVKAKAQAKVIPAPMPQPKIATPLPIVPPTVSYSVLPKYPISALEKDLEGVTILSVYIGMTGKPESVGIKQSAGMAEFDESAKAAVSQWSFSPAIQGGNTIASWFEIPVSFKITED